MPPCVLGFGSVRFEQSYAHGGRAPIRSHRAWTGTRSTPMNFLDLSIVPPGADIGLHTHTMDNEELYVVIAGRGRMTVDGVQFVVGPGDVVVNRPGGTHGLVNDGDEELRLVVVELKAAL